MMPNRIALLAALLLFLFAASATRANDEAVPVLDTAGFWRMHFTFALPVYLEDGKVTPMPIEWHGGRAAYATVATSYPGAGWQKPAFDDAGWTRQAGLVYAGQAANSDIQSAFMAHLALRGKFRVDDPAQAAGMALKIDYRGGLVVYLNGAEIARRHLPRNARPDTLADSTAAGEEGARTLSVALPRAALVKGVNVLAVAAQRAALRPDEIDIQLRKYPQGVYIKRATCAIERIRLSAARAQAAAVTPNVARPVGFQVWNSDPMAPDFDLDYGDPCEPLRPLRLVGARNGAFSAKAVVGATESIKHLKATVSDLAGPQGARIAAANIEIRYALPGSGEVGANPRYLAVPARFKALAETAPDEVPVFVKEPIAPRKGRFNPNESLRSPGIEPVFGAVCPVWVTVNVPKTAAPGDYAGRLTISAQGVRPVLVPIKISVRPFTLPDTRDYRTFAEVIQSPETLAIGYGVPLWSEAHMKLIERSIKLIAQSGGPSVYIPLICETNLGNAETMVRWIRRSDGAWDYDFAPMDRYLDLVEKHQGKPEVVCFWMWDTFLERELGGRGDEKWNEGDVRAALNAQKGHGPEVTVWDPATGKSGKFELPEYTDPKCIAAWRPLAEQLLARMKKRGWEDAAMLGCMCDYQPSQKARANLNVLFPGMKWVSHAHQLPRKDLPMGYAAAVFLRYCEYRDDTTGRLAGWKRPELITHFPRPMRPWFPIAQFRLCNELNLARGLRGSARFGGDFFEALDDKRGRLRGTIAGRFPKSHWHNLRIEVNFLEKGVNGAISTADYEMFREGVQECEARIAIESVLGDKAQRARLGEERAAAMQRMLDDRTRDLRRGVGTFAQSADHVEHYTRPSSWWNRPGILGAQWFTQSGWQDRSQALYDAAAAASRIAP